MLDGKNSDSEDDKPARVYNDVKQRMTFKRIGNCCGLHHEVIMKINTNSTVFEDL